MAARTFSIGGVELDIAARRDHDQLSLGTPGGDPALWQVQRIGTAEFVARDPEDPQRVHTVHAIRDRNTWWIHLDGRTYRFEAVLDRGGAAAPTGTLIAPIPATVVESLVANGDVVAADQVLLVLSAMKMQIEIRAPQSGTVGDLHLEAGDSVEGGERLLTVTPPAADPAAATDDPGPD